MLDDKTSLNKFQKIKIIAKIISDKNGMKLLPQETRKITHARRGAYLRKKTQKNKTKKNLK